MSQLVFVLNVPDHHAVSVNDYVHVGHELVRLVKLQTPFDEGFSLAEIALGDEDTVSEHYKA